MITGTHLVSPWRDRCKQKISPEIIEPPRLQRWVERDCKQWGCWKHSSVNWPHNQRQLSIWVRVEWSSGVVGLAILAVTWLFPNFCYIKNLFLFFFISPCRFASEGVAVRLTTKKKWEPIWCGGLTWRRRPMHQGQPQHRGHSTDPGSRSVGGEIHPSQ